MSLNAAMLDNLSGAFSAVGGLATFTPVSGDPVSLYAVLEESSQVLSPAEVQQFKAQHMITVMRADLAADLARDDEFDFGDGVLYKVTRITGQDPLTVTAVVRREVPT